MEQTTTVCRHCKQEYPSSHFYGNGRQCKKCKLARRREREKTGVRRRTKPELAAAGMRVCTNCQVVKPVLEFSGLNAKCVNCIKGAYPNGKFNFLTELKRRRRDDRESLAGETKRKREEWKHRPGVKLCRSCECEKPFSEFYYGHSRCAECFNKEYGPRARELERQFKANNPRRTARNRRRAQVKRYGMTWEQYKELESRAEGRCELCGDETKQPCVDHCHETGTVRGLLCNGCNLGLGYFRDKPELLERAIAYLQSHGLNPVET